MSSAPDTPEEKAAADGAGTVVPPKPRLTLSTFDLDVIALMRGYEVRTDKQENDTRGIKRAIDLLLPFFPR